MNEKQKWIIIIVLGMILIFLLGFFIQIGEQNLWQALFQGEIYDDFGGTYYEVGDHKSQLKFMGLQWEPKSNYGIWDALYVMFANFSNDYWDLTYSPCQILKNYGKDTSYISNKGYYPYLLPPPTCPQRNQPGYYTCPSDLPITDWNHQLYISSNINFSMFKTVNAHRCNAPDAAYADTWNIGFRSITSKNLYGMDFKIKIESTVSASEPDHPVSPNQGEIKIGSCSISIPPCGCPLGYNPSQGACCTYTLNGTRVCIPSQGSCPYYKWSGTIVIEGIADPFDKNHYIIKNNGVMVCNIIVPNKDIRITLKSLGVPEDQTNFFKIPYFKIKKLYSCEFNPEEESMVMDVLSANSKVNIYQDNLSDTQFKVEALCNSLPPIITAMNNDGSIGITTDINQILYNRLIKGETVLIQNNEGNMISTAIFYITSDNVTGKNYRCAIDEVWNTQSKSCIKISDLFKTLPTPIPEQNEEYEGFGSSGIVYTYSKKEGYTHDFETPPLKFGTETELRIVPRLVCNTDNWVDVKTCVQPKIIYRGQEYAWSNKLSLDYWNLENTGSSSCVVDTAPSDLSPDKYAENGYNSNGKKLQCRHNYNIVLTLKDRKSILSSTIIEPGSVLRLGEAHNIPVLSTYNFYQGVKGYIFMEARYRNLGIQKIYKVPVIYQPNLLTNISLDTTILGDVEISVYPTITLNVNGRDINLVDDRRSVSKYEISVDENRIGSIITQPEIIYTSKDNRQYYVLVSIAIILVLITVYILLRKRLK